MITLPYETRPWPIFRIRVADDFGKPLRFLPMQRSGGHGYELLRLTRKCLPDIGTAVFRYRYGIIDGREYGEVGAEATLSSGYEDLVGKEVTIEASLDDGATWSCDWWGEVVAQDEITHPGADVPAGEVIYHCLDGLHRLSKWTLDRHVPYVDFAGYESFGHPGYNMPAAGGTRVLGNRYNAATTADSARNRYYLHTPPGSSLGTTWTDLQVMQHAIQSAVQPRRNNLNIQTWKTTSEPIFAGNIEPFAGSNYWPVEDGLDCLSLIRSIMDRRRSAGLGCLEFEATLPDDAVPSIHLLPRIHIYDQIRGQISWTRPNAGGTVTINGADTNSTTVAVDLIGDHRVQASNFQVAAESETFYDCVETVGDPITITVTMQMEARWTAGEATAYESAASVPAVADTKYGNVYAACGVPIAFDFQVPDWSGNETDATKTYCDVSMQSGNGSLVSNDFAPASMLTTRIADALPLAVGWNYTVSTAVKYDGTQAPEPDKVPLLLFRRTVDYSTSPAAAERYVDGIEDDKISVRRVGYMELHAQGQAGSRPFDGVIGSLSDYWWTITFETNNRLRYVTWVSADESGRVKRISRAGLGLDLVHNGAIIGLDYDNATSDGATPLHAASSSVSVTNRNDASETFYRVRDDRDELLYWHKLAVEWYTNLRRSARWTLADYGVSGSFDDINGDVIAYPRLGYIVSTLSYSGRTETLNTPITSIEYDNELGLTTYITSWSDKDWKLIGIGRG